MFIVVYITIHSDELAFVPRGVWKKEGGDVSTFFVFCIFMHDACQTPQATRPVACSLLGVYNSATCGIYME